MGCLLACCCNHIGNCLFFGSTFHRSHMPDTSQFLQKAMKYLYNVIICVSSVLYSPTLPIQTGAQGTLVLLAACTDSLTLPKWNACAQHYPSKCLVVVHTHHITTYKNLTWICNKHFYARVVREKLWMKNTQNKFSSKIPSSCHQQILRDVGTIHNRNTHCTAACFTSLLVWDHLRRCKCSRPEK